MTTELPLLADEIAFNYKAKVAVSIKHGDQYKCHVIWDDWAIYSQVSLAQIELSNRGIYSRFTAVNALPTIVFFQPA